MFKKFGNWVKTLYSETLQAVREVPTIAVVFFVPVFVEYLQTGLVLKFPTLIVCGFVILAAIQSFFAGLILSNMAMKNRRDFEYRFNTICEREAVKKESMKEE